MGSTLTFLGTEIAGSAAAGFILGYGVKKLAKLVAAMVAIVTSLIMILLIWLESMGVVTIQVDKLSLLFQDMSQVLSANEVGALTMLAHWFTLGGSFSAGVFLGLKKG